MVPHAAELMVVGKLAHLARRRLDQTLLAEAERGAPQAGEAFDVFLAGVVVDVDALAAGHDGRADLQMTLQRSEEHTSELQSLMRISYAVFCLKKKKSYSNL